MTNQNEKRQLRKIVKELFYRADKNGDGVLSRQELQDYAEVDVSLKNLIERSIKKVRNVDKLIEQDLEEAFHTFIPISANLVTYKEGIHY